LMHISNNVIRYTPKNNSEWPHDDAEKSSDDSNKKRLPRDDREGVFFTSKTIYQNFNCVYAFFGGLSKVKASTSPTTASTAVG
jgi:hypothetical protein